jgi:hypothetical protein
LEKLKSVGRWGDASTPLHLLSDIIPANKSVFVVLAFFSVVASSPNLSTININSLIRLQSYEFIVN